MLSQSQLVCILSFTSVVLRIYLNKVPFWASLFHCCDRNFPDFLAYVFLSWVKTYDYDKFQRNSSIGLARIIV